MTPEQKTNYEKLFNTCIITPARQALVNNAADHITANKSRYEAVGNPLHIPWYIIGIIHNLEGGLNFNTHLHNGDPLSHRTVQVPAGRPVAGLPPFTWEVSATDALNYDGLSSWTDWSISGMLYRLEKFNGMGYFNRGSPSPYLWSFTNQYTKGKYGSDGNYDPNLVSQQCGAAAILKSMNAKGQIALPTIGVTAFLKPTPTGTVTSTTSTANVRKLIVPAGNKVKYYSGTVTAEAKALQALLNKYGSSLTVDGKAGKNTSDAWFKWSGKWLSGDPRS